MFIITDDELRAVGKAALTTGYPQEQAKATLHLMRKRKGSEPNARDIAREVERLHALAYALDQMAWEETEGAHATAYVKLVDHRYIEFQLVAGADQCPAGSEEYGGRVPVLPWWSAIPASARKIIDDGLLVAAAKRELEERPDVTNRKRFRELTDADIADVLGGKPWPIAENASDSAAPPAP